MKIMLARSVLPTPTTPMKRDPPTIISFLLNQHMARVRTILDLMYSRFR